MHQEVESLHTNNFLALAESSESSLYEPGNHRNEMNSLVDGSFEEHIRNILKVSKKVTFHGINYSQNMSICIGKSVWGNFLLCPIELILINDDKTNIFFIGRTSEIISNLEFVNQSTLIKHLTKSYKYSHIPPFLLHASFRRSFLRHHVQYTCQNTHPLIRIIPFLLCNIFSLLQ